MILAASTALACGQDLPIERPRSSPAAPALTKAEIEQAASFREQVGLRADEAWIRFVAAQPDHDTTYDVPLTKAEAEDLVGRVQVAKQVALRIQDYGQHHPDSWAGVYTDQRARGIVVGLFTKDIREHEAAIRTFVSPEARWELRPVEYTLHELQQVMDLVSEDYDWLERRGFFFQGLGIDRRTNRVVLDVEMPAGKDPNEIARHFGNDPRIRIESQPRREWTGGYGTLTIVSTTRQGKAVGDLAIDMSLDEWTPGWGGGAGVGVTTALDGVTRLTDFPAAKVTVRLIRSTSNGFDVAGEGTTTVQPGRKTVLKIIVDRGTSRRRETRGGLLLVMTYPSPMHLLGRLLTLAARRQGHRACRR